MPTSIHPTAIVEPGAVLGADCEIMAHAIVTKHCVLGDRVVVHPFAVVGGDPQYLKFDRSLASGVTVGSGMPTKRRWWGRIVFSWRRVMWRMIAWSGITRC
jgi:acyl-[acyl carrier protein]--UDP-N-acetylglucosamine O-acyltransferase